LAHEGCSLELQTEYVQKYANRDTAEDSDKDNDDDDEMSSVGSYESGDEDEAAGNMEDI
jgi:ubiquitin-conjugating enzyme E2 H